MPDNIIKQLHNVNQRIGDAEQRYKRKVGSVQLLAVSKRQSSAKIEAAIKAGQTRFGENYLQEALGKICALEGYDLEWHFIGPIQSNKTKLISENFAWVHSVCREKIAQRLNDERPVELPPLNVCIQVNTSLEESKSGVLIEDAPALAASIAKLPQLKLRGLMTLPAPSETLAEKRTPFKQLRELFEQLNREGFELDTLSMGMSSDLDAAIAEGATMVRVGTDVFGNRS